MSYERLVAEHDAIERLLVDLERVARAILPDPIGGAVHLRALGLALAEHSANEESAVYTRLLDTPDTDTSRAAAEFSRSYAGLASEVACYLGEWTVECMTADWEGFVAATLAIVERIRERIQRETATIYMLALRRGTIALRAT